MEETKTKTLNLSIECRAYYNAHIEVPANLTFNEAIEYAKQRLDEVPIEGHLEYISGSDVLDIDNCNFNE